MSCCKTMIIFFLGLLLFTACSPVNPGGSGTETTTGIIGAVVDDKGDPQAQVIVKLFPDDYNPVHDTSVIPVDTTDRTGKYSFMHMGSGNYTVQALHLKNRTRAIYSGIHVADDTVTVPMDTLREPGKMIVALPSGVNNQSGYVYVPGTSCFVYLNGAADSAVLDSIPAGNFRSVSYSSTKGVSSDVIRYNITVAPGSISVVHNPSWKYSKNIIFNTTQSGADVPGMVEHFPVMLHLTSSNFDFTQAHADGADIRFARSDNTFLPYEIKRWDSALMQAEVWVKVDTIYGNDSTQSITMYWGNPDASGNSSGASVFDSTSGFEGVWHLNEMSGTTASDASQNNYSGIYNGGLPRNAIGPSGICQSILKPDSDYIDVGDVLNPGMKNISVGIWVKRAAFGTQQALIAKSNGDGPSATYGYLLSIDLLNFTHFYLISGGSQWGDPGAFDVSSNLTITDSTEWHYLFVSIDRSDNSKCKLYIDGIDRTGTIRGDVSLVNNVTNALRLHIGTESDNGYSYKGAIAEANIAFVTRSADWVKLCYMNQKDKDALVKW